MMRLCVQCSKEFEVPRGLGFRKMTCSPECRDADKRMQTRERKQATRAAAKADDDGWLPAAHNVDSPKTRLEWDGEATYSNLGPLKFPYVRKCFMCGRHPDLEWFTDAQVRYYALRGIGSCDVCGGWRFLDLQEVSGMGSPTKAAPARTVAEPVRPLRHHAA